MLHSHRKQTITPYPTGITCEAVSKSNSFCDGKLMNAEYETIENKTLWFHKKTCSGFSVLNLLSFKEINVKHYLFPFVSDFFLQKHAEIELSHTVRVVRKPGVSDTGLGTDQQCQESSVCSRHRSRWQSGCAGVLRSAGCRPGLWYQVSLIIFYPFLLLYLTATRTETAVFPQILPVPGQSVCSA